MDRLEAMSLFVAVAEAGSLSAAGRKLGVPLPTVSRKISDLEAHLNTRLLTRSTRKLALTDTGAAYVAAAKRILDEVSEAERAASGDMPCREANSSSPRPWSLAGCMCCRSSPSFSPNGPISMSGSCLPTATCISSTIMWT